MVRIQRPRPASSMTRCLRRVAVVIVVVVMVFGHFLSSMTKNPSDAAKVENIIKANLQGTAKKIQQVQPMPAEDATDENSPIRVYYHIHVPKFSGPDKVERTNEVVREHLEALLSSDLRSRIEKIRYLTAGKRTDNYFEDKVLSDYCKHIDCQYMGHIEESDADEEITLMHMWDDCQSSSAQVMYVHTKPSLHPKERDAWRGNLFTSLLHADCNNLGPCDVCGLRALPFPVTHYIGNLWTAQCRHIRRLVSPDNWEASMQAVKTQLQSSSCDFDYSLVPGTEQTMFATGEHAASHWVASHPSSVMCDMQTEGDVESQVLKPSAMTRQTFPLADWTAAWPLVDADAQKALIRDQSKRLREYALLPGVLMRAMHFYSEAPSAGSWLWRFFPDAAFWQKQLQSQGKDAVQKVCGERGH